MAEQLPSGAAPDWRRVWEQTAVALRRHVDGGLRRLLTEDVVRFALITELVRAGVDPQRITVEARDPALPGGRLDLVVDTGSEAAHVLEIKFPRDPLGSGAADTMTLGELLSDVYRPSLVKCEKRFAVQIIDRRLLTYLDRRAALLGWLWPRHGDQFRLTPEMVGELPKTAAGMLPPRAVEVVTTARCVEQMTIDDGLLLLVHEVDAAKEAESGRELTVAPPPSGSIMPETGEVAAPIGRLGGARAEILDVVAALTVRRSATDAALDDIVREMKRRGSPYADSTVRTMVSSHMLNSGPGGADPDLLRVGRGRYRSYRRSDSADVEMPVGALADPEDNALNPSVRHSLIGEDILDRVLDRYMHGSKDWGLARNDWRSLLRVLIDRMELLARENQTQTYSDLVAGTPLQQMPGWHHAIAWALGVVAEACHESGLPLLTAVIYGKSTNVPGPGFAAIAKRLGRRGADDELAYWIEELNRVHESWSLRN